MSCEPCYYISYRIGGGLIAGRIRPGTPRVGDKVKLNGDIYLVDSILWNEDEDRNHVYVDLSKL